MAEANEKRLQSYYRALYEAWGPQHWWPAGSRWEVIVGAYLTQNTAWTNVERAMANLRRERALSLKAMRDLPLAELERLIRPSGYFRQKAQRLKLFIDFLDRKYGGSLTRMMARPTVELREELLALHGVGPETADSILLYAGNHPVFVVDAYTRRILTRHEILPAEAPYEEVRELFEKALAPLVTASGGRTQARSTRRIPASHAAPHPPSKMSKSRRAALAQTYNEMHGLIVGVGKDYCKKSEPRCESCPLCTFLPANTPQRKISS